MTDLSHSFIDKFAFLTHIWFVFFQGSWSQIFRRQYLLPVQSPSPDVRLRVDSLQRPLPLHEHEADDDAERVGHGRAARVFRTLD